MQNKLKKFLRPSLILALLLAAVVLVEAYLAFRVLYPDLSTSVSDSGAEDVVRLDLASYNQEINVLDSNSAYQPGTKALLNPNPFQ